MQNQQMLNQVTTATVEGTRDRERPCKRWRGKVQEDVNVTRIKKKKLLRDHWEWRKIVLEAKVHNRLQCCRRRKRNRRKGIIIIIIIIIILIIIIIIIIIHFNQYLLCTSITAQVPIIKPAQKHKHKNSTNTQK